MFSSSLNASDRASNSLKPPQAVTQEKVLLANTESHFESQYVYIVAMEIVLVLPS